MPSVILIQRIETIEVTAQDDEHITVEDAFKLHEKIGDDPKCGVEVISIDYYEHLDNKTKMTG